ncbi:MAG: GAF domain-containing protein [Cytophagales bacterium]|nr:MAG: GAF domain-containing protein [Cytophagales bacterium]
MIKLKNIFELGIKSDYNEYLKSKIKLTNQFSFYFSLYALLFAGISLSVHRIDLCYIALISFVLYITPLLLNRFGMSQTARFFMSVIPAIVLAIIHTIAVEPDQEVISNLIIIQLSALLLPWILYDLQEKKKLFLSFAIYISMIALPYFFNDLIDTYIEASILRSSLFEFLALASFISVNTLCLFMLQKNNTATNIRNAALVLEMQQQQYLLHKNEDKLSNYIKEIEKSKEEDKIRQWRADGIAKFNEIIRKDSQQVQKLYDEIIAEMVKYVSANQGGFFILKEEEGEEEPFLEMAACYAYERSKYIDKRIYVSEGLMGQAYQDKEPMMLTEIPPQYIQITSGLGKALPRCILIVPLKYNENICGIIELASFNTFQPYHIEFVRRVGEIVASAILTSQNNEKTQELLRETQHQSEQMRAQEEEMRQNLEELNATQEEMQRRQTEMELTNIKMKNNEEVLKKLVIKMQSKEQENKQQKEELIQQFAEKEAAYLAKIQTLEKKTN